MKECRYCHALLPIEQFEIANVIKGREYRRHKCKNCKQAGQNVRRKRIALWVQTYKKTLSCEHCSISDYRVLAFHHVDPKTKDFEIGHCSTWSIARIKQEMAKCIVLCANCHIIEHARSSTG